jgi:putative Holliday junction resolvase
VDASGFEGELDDILEELGPSMVVVGLPTSLAGVEGASADGARALGRLVSERSGLPVEFADERFTSARADELLSRSLRDRRDRRDRVDATAAAVMLQSWLDARAGEARGNPRYASD